MRIRCENLQNAFHGDRMGRDQDVSFQASDGFQERARSFQERGQRFHSVWRRIGYEILKEGEYFRRRAVQIHSLIWAIVHFDQSFARYRPDFRSKGSRSLLGALQRDGEIWAKETPFNPFAAFCAYAIPASFIGKSLLP